MPTLERLSDVIDEFMERKRSVWEQNTKYWLKGRLRHVTDTGDFLLDRVTEKLVACKSTSPVILDMGCGNGWLARGLQGRNTHAKYIGVDFNEGFVNYCKAFADGDSRLEFLLMDLERPVGHSYDNRIDIVVNAFNFFELADLKQAMINAAKWLRPGGSLIVMTIDKTFLLMGAVTEWHELIRLLREYEELPGIKCFFQPIDLGDGLSENLIYPSVLYTFEDYLEAANTAGLKLSVYKELPFTSRPIPKIYLYFELSLDVG